MRIIKWLKSLIILIMALKEKGRGYTPKTQVKAGEGLKQPTEVKGVNLLIIRDTFTENSTIGELFIDGERFCDTLENPYINNERNISCIPEGRYKVRLRLPRESATREYLHLLVQDVPNRDWILFHRGNKAEDTRGCILLGQGSEQDVVYNSRLAMDLVIKEILNLGGENINLIIKNK